MTISLDDSYAYCKSLSRRTAGNFYFSFLTIPAELARDMCVLYAFMRISDDLGDDDRIPVAERSEQLARWKAHLTSSLVDADHRHAVFPALADVVGRHQIPHEYLFAVIQGVEMDLEPAGFQTFDDLCRYCYHVAGVVGLCCIHMWGFHDHRALDRAIDCGIAFQLTNILRDLGEDAEMGRLYLPREDLQRFGLTADDISNHCRDERFVELMKFEVQRARSYYRRAEELFEHLEPAGQPILSAMLRIYGGLLRQIERSGYDVYSRRLRLPVWRKLWITLDTIVRKRWRR